jgi:hypothetical protein
MGFWDTFFRVWQIRTSARIQESIENSFKESRENSELETNIPKIIDELGKKNLSWDAKINYQREKNKIEDNERL